MNSTNPKKRKDSIFKFDKMIGVPYYILLVTLIVFPLLIMILYSFQDKNQNGLLTSEFSINHYMAFFEQVEFVRAMGYSILLAVIATTLTLLFAYPTAYFLVHKKVRTQVLYLSLISGTMWINMILRTNAVMQILMLLDEHLGTRTMRTNGASVFGMVYMYFPYMFLPIYTVLSKMDYKLFEASNDLGANKFQTLVRVVMPLSIPGVLSGIIMVLLPATTTVVIPAYLGPTTQLFIGQIIEGTYKQNGVNSGAINKAAAMAVALGVIMIGIMFLINLLDPKRRGEVKNEQKG